MNDNIQMSVSSIVSNKEKKQIYVSFSDATRSAEVVLPDAKCIRNDGFSEEEIAALEFYAISHKDEITELAKKINVMDAFLK